jgi:hypothetical protein
LLPEVQMDCGSNAKHNCLEVPSAMQRVLGLCFTDCDFRDGLDDPLEDQAMVTQQLDQVCSLLKSIKFVFS